MYGPEHSLPARGWPGTAGPPTLAAWPSAAPGKSCRSPLRTSRAAPRPRVSEAARDAPSPPTPRPVRPRQRPATGGAPGVLGALPGVGRGPLTISTWRGSSWLGGAGTENWIFLRSLGSMAGGVAGGPGGARLGVPGCGPGSASPRCSGRGGERWLCAARGRRAAHAQIKIPRAARGGRASGRGSRGLRAPPTPGSRARPPRPLQPGLPARGLGVSVPLPESRLSLLPSLSPRVSVGVSAFLSLPPFLSVRLYLCFSPSLRVSPSGPSLGVPGPSPRPGTGARGLGGRAQGEVANEHREPCSPRAGRRVRSVSQDPGSRLGAPCSLPRT